MTMLVFFNHRMLLSIIVSLTVHAGVAAVLVWWRLPGTSMGVGDLTLTVRLVREAGGVAKEIESQGGQVMPSAAVKPPHAKLSLDRDIKRLDEQQGPDVGKTSDAVGLKQELPHRGPALPKMISLPWTQGLEVRPVGDEQGYSTNRALQASVVAQNRVVQLNENLVKLFSKEGGDISGRCNLDNYAASGTALICIPSRLDQLILTEKYRFIEALQALSAAGKYRDRLTVDYHAGRLVINFYGPEQQEGADN